MYFQLGDLECCKILLSNGAEVNQWDSMKKVSKIKQVNFF